MDGSGKGQTAENSQAVLATAQLLADHKNDASTLQGFIDRCTARAAHPAAALIIAGLAAAWIAGNLLVLYAKGDPPDPPPFYWLQGAMSLTGVLVALLLLSTQRREGQLADRRAHLILEMAVRAEQKSAKSIELLEEARRDNPLLRDRRDREAEAMAMPTDHVSVLGEIRKADT